MSGNGKSKDKNLPGKTGQRKNGKQVGGGFDKAVHTSSFKSGPTKFAVFESTKSNKKAKPRSVWNGQPGDEPGAVSPYRGDSGSASSTDGTAEIPVAQQEAYSTPPTPEQLDWTAEEEGMDFTQPLPGMRPEQPATSGGIYKPGSGLRPAAPRAASRGAYRAGGARTSSSTSLSRPATATKEQGAGPGSGISKPLPAPAPERESWRESFGTASSVVPPAAVPVREGRSAVPLREGRSGPTVVRSVEEGEVRDGAREMAIQTISPDDTDDEGGVTQDETADSDSEEDDESDESVPSEPESLRPPARLPYPVPEAEPVFTKQPPPGPPGCPYPPPTYELAPQSSEGGPGYPPPNPGYPAPPPLSAQPPPAAVRGEPPRAGGPAPAVRRPPPPCPPGWKWKPLPASGVPALAELLAADFTDVLATFPVFRANMAQQPADRVRAWRGLWGPNAAEGLRLAISKRRDLGDFAERHPPPRYADPLSNDDDPPPRTGLARKPPPEGKGRREAKHKDGWEPPSQEVVHSVRQAAPKHRDGWEPPSQEAVQCVTGATVRRENNKHKDGWERPSQDVVQSVTARKSKKDSNRDDWEGGPDDTDARRRRRHVDGYDEDRPPRKGGRWREKDGDHRSYPRHP